MNTITLSQFHQKVSEIAKILNSTYVSVSVEMSKHENSDTKYEFSAYIHGFEWYRDDDFNNLIKTLTELAIKPINTNPDIEFNIEGDIKVELAPPEKLNEPINLDYMPF